MLPLLLLALSSPFLVQDLREQNVPLYRSGNYSFIGAVVAGQALYGPA